jgi:hypothetical protein
MISYCNFKRKIFFMTDEKNEERKKENLRSGKINLDEYAGDAEDNEMARKQSSSYIKSVEEGLKKPAGDSKKTSEE